jgi:hexosaminidase
MWNEYTSPETVDSRIWPRMAVIAERFWSARDVGDAKSMYDRMEAVSRKLEWTGVRHRAARRPMLERLGGDTAALEVLADASEATGITVRRDARKYTSPVPLNRFVDAVRPESETVRRLEIAARTNPNAELRATFRTWSEIEPRIDIVELKSLSHNMALAGSIGLRALDLLQSGQAPPENWISEQDRILAAMAKPQAEVVLAAARPVRALLARWNKKAASVASRLPPAPEPRPPAPPRASAATDSTHVRSGNEHVVPHPQRF